MTDFENKRAGKAITLLPIQMKRIVTRTQGRLDLGRSGSTIAFLLSTLIARRVNTLEETVR